MRPELASTSSDPPDSAAAPDWRLISQAVKCPLCEYNLRGLIEPRCPECGYPFEWPVVLEPDKYRHPYLFEHHPRRPHWSFFHTLIHHLNPGRFWWALDASQPVRPARIALYWSGCCILLLLFGGVGFWSVLGYQTSRRPIAGTLWEAAQTREASVLGLSLAMLALFPWLNFLTLLIFQQSMRRAKIKMVHVLRCAIYGGDVIVWCAVVMAIIFLTAGSGRDIASLRHPLTSFFLKGNALIELLAWALLVMVVVNGLRLWAAYRLYLRMPHAVATAIASQMIVVLAALGAFAYVSVYW